MLRAVVFDFDGVIADAEPLHLRGFQSVLSEYGIILTDEDYYRYYLAYDDRRCLAEVLRREGREFDRLYLEELVEKKSEIYMRTIKDHLVIFPGVERLISELSCRYPLAIGSGARKDEIEFILDVAGLRGYFSVIVSAEEVRLSKPSPETYRRVLEELNRLKGGNEVPPYPIAPYECLVIEDSVHGVEAALGAGMRCIAVTNTYSREELKDADLVVDSLERLNIERIESLFDCD